MKFLKKIPREFFRLINQLLSLAESDYIIIKKQNSNQIIEKKYKDYWIMMPLSSFGDSLVFFKFIKEFKNNRGGKVLVVSNQERILKLAKMFPDIDETKLISDQLYFNNINNLFEIKIGKIFSCNMYLNFIFNKPSKNMLSRARELFEIKTETYGESPIISKSSNDEAKKIIDHYKLYNQKIVLISPFSVAINCKSLSENFWLNIAKELNKKGFRVVFNSKSSLQNDNQDFINIFCDIGVISAFANMCHSIIGMRSGLLDVLRDVCESRILAIYNHNHSNDNLKRDFYVDDKKSFIENYIQCCSLNMYEHNNNIELIYYGSEGDFEQEVIKLF